MGACRNCNDGFATDEEYFRLLLQCVLNGTTDPDQRPAPEVGIRMMTRIVTNEGLAVSWITVQKAVYMYSVDDWRGSVCVIRAPQLSWDCAARRVSRTK